MNEDLDLLISEIDECYSLVKSYRLIMRYFISCLELIRDRIPNGVTNCFLIATEYWNGEGSQSELDEARITCWEYLDKIEREGCEEKIPASAVRALICVLYASPSTDDTHDLVYWFVSHVSRVADVDDRLILNTKMFFPDITFSEGAADAS